MHHNWRAFFCQQQNRECLGQTLLQLLGCVLQCSSTIAILIWTCHRKSSLLSCILGTLLCRYVLSLICNTLTECDSYINVQVYQRLARLNITVSHRSVIRLLDSVGKNFQDSQVKEWRDSILPTLNSSNVIVSLGPQWSVHTVIYLWCSKITHLGRVLCTSLVPI